MESTHKKKITKHRICFVAGRSGGHILPCITLAQQTLHRHPDYEIVFFSTTADLDTKLLSNNPLVTFYIPLPIDSLRYNTLLRYPIFMWHLIKAFFISIYHLRSLRPEAVISTGGYVSLPVCLAAKVLSIPIELYELNVTPGKAIKFLAPFAHKIWICYEQSRQFLPSSKCTVTNYPIKFNDKTHIIKKETALQALSFSEKRATLLILGGSQGSLFINTLVRHILEIHKDIHMRIQIIHQTGSTDTTDWHALYETLGIPARVFSYSNEIGTFYAAADLVLCRSGAGTLAEIMFFNKKCITIPLETKTTMHQVDNALAAQTKNPELITVFRQKEIEVHYQVLYSLIKQSLL